MKRLLYIDNIKGFGIFLVVLGHVLVQNYPTTYHKFLWFDFIQCWYMEMFFFFSGYVYTYKGGSLLSFTWKSFKSLIYPCIIIFFLGEGIREILSLLWTGNSFHFEPLLNFYWFCKCLFVSRVVLFILCWLYVKSKNIFLNELNTGIFITVILFFSSKYGIDVPWGFRSIFIFYVLGYCFRKYQIDVRLKDNKKLFILSVLLLMIIACSRYNLLGVWTLPDIITNNSIAILMIYIVFYTFSKFFNRNCLLTSWGGQSLLIYLLHITLLRTIVLFNKVFIGIEYRDIAIVFVEAIILTILSYYLSLLIKKYHITSAIFLLKK